MRGPRQGDAEAIQGENVIANADIALLKFFFMATIDLSVTNLEAIINIENKETHELGKKTGKETLGPEREVLGAIDERRRLVIEVPLVLADENIAMFVFGVKGIGGSGK